MHSPRMTLGKTDHITQITIPGAASKRKRVRCFVGSKQRHVCIRMMHNPIDTKSPPLGDLYAQRIASINHVTRG